MKWLRSWLRRRAERKLVRDHLRTFGCALWCPRCKTLIVERVMVLPLGNGDYRYMCRTCGFEPVFNFDIAPIPICVNKHLA